jgi:splicing factor 3A subunit 2
MDFQNRVGSKFGGGGPASAAEVAADRQARQHRLGLEAFDIDKDPYVVRNNLGQFVCKLCVTVHRTLPSYIAHTQVSPFSSRSEPAITVIPREMQISAFH